MWVSISNRKRAKFVKELEHIGKLSVAEYRMRESATDLTSLKI